jgi:hypothetical protein
MLHGGGGGEMGRKKISHHMAENLRLKEASTYMWVKVKGINSLNFFCVLVKIFLMKNF